jgi:hypothetical protein
MGTQDIILDQIYEGDNYYYIIGDNYTKWSKVYIDGAKVSTSYISSKLLRIKKSKMEEGTHEVVVSQVGSSNTIFRSSEPLTYTVKASETE